MHSADDANDIESEPIFDRKQARNYYTFLKGSMRRHRLMALLVFLTIVGATVGALYSLPKTYHVQAKVLAHKNPALTVRGDSEGNNTALTGTAAETILRHDSLVALIHQTNLVEHYQAHLAPSQRARNAIVGLFGADKETADDRVEDMVKLLEKRLSVWTDDGGNTVTIAINWPDPHMACRIIDAAQQNYLEARYADEVTALSESIAILQSHATSAKTEVDTAVSAIDKLRAAKDSPPRPAGADRTPTPAPAPRMVVAPRRVEAPPPAETAARVALKARIEAKQRTLSDLEDFRHHRLSELQSRLADARTLYTQNHPAVVDLEQAVASVSGDSPQVKSLRTEIAGLQDEYKRGESSAADPPGRVRPAPRYVPAPVSAAPATPRPLADNILGLDLQLREDRDPDMVYARGQLREAMTNYATLRTHIQTAQIDLDTAKAAFKYRYSVVQPAHLPRKPVKPKAPLVIFAGVLAAAAVSLVLAVIADLRRGRLVERWQLERLLDRPIVAEIELPRLPEPDVQ